VFASYIEQEKQNIPAGGYAKKIAKTKLQQIVQIRENNQNVS